MFYSKQIMKSVVLGLFVFAATLHAAETVKDEFSSRSYSNNDGTVNWSGDWIENDYYGATGGNIQVYDNQLYIHGKTTSSNPAYQPRIERQVNLDGASSAILSLDWKGGRGFESADKLFIDASSDGGAHWTTIHTLTGPEAERATGSITEDITPYASANTRIRFRVIDTRGSSEYFYLDNVQISYTTVPPVSAGELKGKVYLDSNADGEKTGENGQADVIVTVYDDAGVAVATATTDANGEYEISGLDDALKYRLEFTNIPTNLNPGPSGTNNYTTTVFVQSPQADVDLGLTDSSGFCQANPIVATPGYANGNPLGGGSTSSKTSLYLFPYKASGTSGFSTGATQTQTGSTWGLAYQKESKKLFSSAVLKRHTGLGSYGLGAIYVRDMVTGSTNLLVDVTDLGVDVGAIASNGSRGLPSDTRSPSNDTESFTKIAKVGIGDIDLSEDGGTLYMTNLNERQIYALPVGNPATTPATAIALPGQPWLEAGACTDGLGRPWGLKNHGGKLYVGVVCTGEFADDNIKNVPAPSSLRGRVYAYDPVAQTWAMPMDFPLDYKKGQTSTVRHNNEDTYWLTWTDRYINDTNHGHSTANGVTYMEDSTRTSRPMPILSDIEFDSKGAMILGFMDRGGMMFGNGNYPPTGTRPLHQYNVSGDLLRACSDGAGGWTLENRGACGGVTAGGANAQGPGGGEYYTGDNFRIHQETIMGGIAQHPATDEITVVTMDPLSSVDAGGVRWISNTTGKDTRGLQLYQGSPNNPSNGTFGKGVGLGDVEILCDPAPLEIGNYVWVDTDADGIQDPNEAPIANVTLELWDNGVKVGETQTDAKGEYYFGGVSDKGMLGGNHLLPYHDYEIRLPLNDPDIPVNHVPTVMDQGTDMHDSDGDNGGIHSGYSTIKLTTGKAGENNHTFDFGFTPPIFDLALKKVLATGQPTTISAGDKVKFTITVYNQGTANAFDIDVQDYIPTDTSYSASGSTADATVLTTTNGNSATLTNNGDGTFEISELTAGDNVSFDIELDVSPGFAGTTIRNWAEISDGSLTDGGGTATDIDSTPDSTQFDGNGETDDLADDNVIDQSGKGGGDEDDHDPAEVNVISGQFDLALKKVLATGQASTVNPGDKVTFTVTVYNQGNVKAYDIDVVDYIPANTTYSTANSTPTSTLTTNGSASTGFTNPNDGTFTIDELGAGDSVSFDIAVDIAADFTGTTICNWAEISDGTDTDGGTTTTDIDSIPNATNFNDAGETDDLTDDNVIDQSGKGGGDEDDHDPAEVTVTQVFDLALKKVLAVGQASTVAQGDEVTFTITVYNQGTLPAYDVDIKDYIDGNMSYISGTAEGGIVTEKNYLTVIHNHDDGTFEIEDLPQGDSVDFNITLKVDGGFQGTSIINWAEISHASLTNNGPTATDIDSIPDDQNFNQPGETNDLVDDNRITESGKAGGDEDDHDPAEVTVGQSFDLALKKTLAAGQASTVNPGDTVKFTITVYNQGTLDAFDIDVKDYIPADMTYSAADSTVTGGVIVNNDDGTFEITELAAGADVSFDIALTLDAGFQGKSIRNWAEITDGTDTDGGATTTDIDSTPDDTNFNQGGETDDLDDDNEIGGNGKAGGDEDDHDPAEVTVEQSFDLALKKVLKTATVVNPGDVAIFTITVYNQGSLDAFDIDVKDYIPTDMTYSAAGSTTTGGVIVNNGDGTFEITELAADSNISFDIALTVNADFKGTTIRNWAEITDGTETDGGTTTTDIDSIPDDQNFNQAGETDDLDDDDKVNEDGKNGGDEDDHDPAEVIVTQIFDLALMKTLAAGQADTIVAGDTVKFTITVYNQGTSDAFDVNIMDYIPVDATYMANGSTVTGTMSTVGGADTNLTNNGDGTFALSSLPSGDSVQIDIALKVNGTFAGQSIINWAEISAANDKNGPATDIDSTPDTTQFNGGGETDDLNDDNKVNEDGKNGGDEDDHDPALVHVTPKPVSIGSYVWEDTNKDGLQGMGEPAVAGAVLELIDAVTGQIALDRNNAPIAPQTTGADGYYIFDDLLQGNYKVRITVPPIYKKTPIQTGADDNDTENDSNIKTDINATTYESGMFTLIPDSEPVETNNEKGDDQDESPAAIADDVSGNMTVDFGFIKLVPKIKIIKKTNGESADAVPGPTITVGDVISWTYEVSNTGEVPLTAVTVTDDKVAVADISCPVDNNDNVIDALAVGATVTCTASGTATAGQYVNNGTVSGIPPSPQLPPPTDNNESHYFGGSSSIDIEKSTNGEDADVTPGPTINVGDAITWTYLVTNTGNVALTDVTVTDDKVAAADIDCGGGNNVVATLAAGATATCTATSVAVAGQYENTASVTGTPPTGTPPTDNDPSHYFGGSSSIDIEKSTNGEDADVTPGPTINVGDAVTWTYRVENTGNVALTDVTVTDDKVAAADIACPVDNGDNVIASMAAGQVILCTAKGVATQGQYTNQASVTGTPPTGTPPTDNDPSHYFGGSSSIDIEKSTNGEDADVTPGPTINVGDAVTWTYRVENTGNVALTDVTVTDDKVAAADIACPVDNGDNVIASMAAGQVILCTAKGVATQGQYTNQASVTGTPPTGTPPTDNDPSHYFGGSSSIDIEKSTNGEDADVTPGPTINVGDAVTWTYRVENTGNVALTDVTVTDDKVAAADIACPVDNGDNVIASMAAGQVILCTAKGVATQGQYTNQASVTGTPPTGTPPTDNDPSHYFGGSSSIDIEKSTNGEDADVTPGPTINVGDAVTWTYRVENTGNVALTDVTVTDDKVAAADIACPVDNGDNVIASMAAGQVILCTAKGVATQGQYTNQASVTGTPPTGTPPTDNDPSHYFGGSSSIDIEKSTNGEDADVTPGPTINVGDAVTWTYRVENTGNVPLTEVNVTDDKVSNTDIRCTVSDTDPTDNIIDTIDVGQVILCTATGVALEGQYENTATVNGIPPGSNPPPVTDDDPSHYFGGSSSIDIEKSTNGEDADVTPGPTINVGDAVTWTYRVENTGNVALTDVTVTDDKVAATDIHCAIDDNDNVIGTLAAAQVVICTATGVATTGQYGNTASVTGTPPTGTPPTDNDPSHYFGGSSSIDIEKSTNGEDADVTPGPTIAIDDTVTWTYLVKNTGNVVLTNVVVSDDKVAAADISCPVDNGDNSIASLAVGQEVACTATGIAASGQYSNIANVTGTPPTGTPPTDNDPSHYFGGSSSIDIEKSTNGKDADVTPGPTINVGDAVTWTYRVENTGNVALTDVIVTDDKVATAEIHCTIDDNDNVIDILSPAQVVLCTATGIALAGQYTNQASVTGTPPVGVPPTDNDPSHYFGGNGSIDIEKSTNGKDADIVPGPTVKVGDTVTWTYRVENTGNVALTDVTVVDDKGIVIACPIADTAPNDNIIDTLAVGQVVVCTGSGVAEANQYANNAVVTGSTPTGSSVTDDDPSHYFGATSSIKIEKSTNGEDADAAPGPKIPVGDPVTWTYTVTNTGTSELLSVMVSDDKLPDANISCPVDDGDNNISSLGIGQTVVCTATGIAQPYQYANTGKVIGEPNIPNAPKVTDDDPSHYFGSESGISIEKSTNGEDADAVPGPTISVGDTVTWTYRVENTGNLDLTHVVVTDDRVAASQIICPTDNGSDNIIDVLAPAQVVMCTATGIAKPDQYANMGSVTGKPPVGIPPSDNDPSHYFGATSSIDIEKLTNGQDADVVPGPTIGIGDTVTWSYKVKNTGNVALTDVMVTDDKVAATNISCPVDNGDNNISSLAIGQIVVCTATGVSVAGQYENTATVTGKPPVGAPPSDSDKSHYYGADQKIDIEKSTNGEDADVAPGPVISIGNVVTWSYKVTNTGNVRLDNVIVVDDKVAAASINCPANNGTSNVIAALTPGQSIVCTATGTSVDGDYENNGSVIGTPVEDNGTIIPGLTPPTDSDLSHYFGGSAKIDIEKSTNGKDADTGPGDTIYVGEPISWTYVVKNIGNTVLTNVTITDNKLSDANISCSGGSNIIPALNVGQEMVCVAQGMAVEGLYENNGSVTGTPPTGIPLTDSDLSHYTGVKPKVSLGSTVFEDSDDNGVQDPGEPGIDGVKLQLFKTGDQPTGTPVAEVTSSGGGNYIFKDLDEGDYYVYIPTPPTNLPLSSTTTNTNDDQVDGDDNGDQPGGSGTPVRSPNINLAANQEPMMQETEQGGTQDDLLNDYNGDMTVDFGFTGTAVIPKASLGDVVWYDDNENGIQDPAENGVDHVKVYLLDGAGNRIQDGSGNDIFTETNSTGEYRFENLEPNREYAVAFDLGTLPPGFEVTEQDEGTDESKDSDADLTTGITDPVLLNPGQYYPDLDMGIHKKPGVSLYHIGTHFWIDNDGDSKYDGGDKGVDEAIDDALVELLDENKTKLYWTDDTNSSLTTTPTAYPAQTRTIDGVYGFDVPAGKYNVRFNIPQALKDKGFVFANRQTESGDNLNRAGSDGITTPVEVGPGIAQQDLTLDAAVVCPCSSITSDGGDALNIFGVIGMLFILLLSGLIFVRREEYLIK